MRNQLSSPKKVSLFILLISLLLGFQQCFAVNANWRKAKPEIPNGKDDDLDGLIDEDYPVLAWYADNDSDGFGAGTAYLSTYALPGYVTLPSDCDDADATVNPFAIEICDGIDNDCDGDADEGIFKYYADTDDDDCADDAGSFIYSLCESAPDGYTANPPCNVEVDLTLTTSDKLIGRFMGGGSTTDCFFQGPKPPTGLDPTRQPWLSIFESGNFTTLDNAGGQFIRYYHVLPGVTGMFTAGNGWNAIQPADPTKQNGELVDQYFVNGKPLDFYLAFDTLCKATGAQRYILPNIVEGSMDEFYWQIERAGNQSVIPIQYNEEGPTQNDIFNGTSYGVSAYRFIDSVEAHFPDKTFIHVLDIAQLWQPTNGDKLWNSQLIGVRAIDSNQVAIRVYNHGWKFWELTGDPAQDTALVNAGVLQLQATTDSIRHSGYKGCKVFVRQITASDYSKTSFGNSTTLKSTWPLVSWYAQVYKHLVEATRDGLVKYEGSNIVGLNQMIDTKKDIPNMDWQALSVSNNLFTEQRYALYTSSLGPGIDVYGGQKDGVYCIIIQNKTGVDIPTPKNIVFDGMQFNGIEPSFSQCLYANDLFATTLQPYNASTTIEGLSINCFIYTPNP